jgi:hypothetical protein
LLTSTRYRKSSDRSLPGSSYLDLPAGPALQQPDGRGGRLARLRPAEVAVKTDRAGRGHPISDELFGWFLPGIIADAVLFTWLYNSTGGSLLLVVLFHTSIAVTGLFLATASAPPLLELLLKWIVVGVVVGEFGAANLSRAERQVARSSDGRSGG